LTIKVQIFMINEKINVLNALDDKNITVGTNEWSHLELQLLSASTTVSSIGFYRQPQ